MRTPFIATSRTNETNWTSILFLAGYHVALFITLPLYLLWRTPSTGLIIAGVVLMIVSLVAVTAGYHRLYAHVTYRTRKAVEGVLLFFATLATQGSALEWAHDHRLHHKHVDSDGDPYGTQHGFWQSHLLWMFKKRKAYDERYIRDLRQNKLLVFQDRHYGWLMAGTNILAVAVVGWLTGDLIGAFVIAFLLRLFVAHHCTWFINSLAHMWGSKPYSHEHSAVNNFILALLTYGEGYHNYHHTFAGDYRNGVRWYQFDPPKYLIWTLSKLGLASDLKRMDPLMIKKKLLQADRSLLLGHLEQVYDTRKAALMETVEKTSHRLSETISSIKSTRDRYRSLEPKSDPVEARQLKVRFRELQAQMREDLKTWKWLCRTVIKMEVAVAVAGSGMQGSASMAGGQGDQLIARE